MHETQLRERPNFVKKFLSKLKKLYKKPKRIIYYSVTMRCNYCCTYCTQQQQREAGKNSIGLDSPDDVVDGFIKFIKKQKFKCLVNLIGGEIFVHPRIFDIIEAILSKGHDLNITTNFSYPIETYKKISELNIKNAKINLGLSLHLDHVSINQFKNKLELLQSIVNDTQGKLSFGVHSVLKEDNFDILKEFDKYLKEKYNINLVFQNYRDANGGISYNKKIEEYIEKIENKNKEFERKKSSSFKDIYGTLCYAGKSYCSIRSDGTVYRCYKNKKQGALSVLGDIRTSKVKFFYLPKPCLSDKCSCPSYLALGLVKTGHKNYIYTSLCKLIYVDIYKKISSIKNKLSNLVK